MNIPDEAIEAAARVHQLNLAKGGQVEFDKMWTTAQFRRLAWMREALEAALPYLLADVKAATWDECEAAKYDIRLNPSGVAWEAVKDNPYRTTK